MWSSVIGWFLISIHIQKFIWIWPLIGFCIILGDVTYIKASFIQIGTVYCVVMNQCWFIIAHLCLCLFNWFLVLNATFNIISVIAWPSVLLVVKPEYPEKATNLSYVNFHALLCSAWKDDGVKTVNFKVQSYIILNTTK